MKIGILTFHNAYNYGAMLQAYATQEILSNMGHETYFVGYKNPKIVEQYKLFKGFDKIHSLKQLIHYIISLPIRFFRYRSFDNFLKKELNPIVELSNKKEFESTDLFVVGSDQLWNRELTNGMDEYYWAKNKLGKKYISFSTSAGKDLYTDLTTKEIETLLNAFESISVRESILKERFSIINNSISITADPTLCLNPLIWDKFRNIIDERKKYILAYYNQNEDKVLRLARQMAKDKELKLIVLCINGEFSRDSEKKAIVSPAKFVSYIANAEYVITSSFHGTAFSLIFNRDFYCYIGNGNNRIESLLNEVGASHRIVNSYDDMIRCPDIDYNIVQEKLQHMRQNANLYLKTHLV